MFNSQEFKDVVKEAVKEHLESQRSVEERKSVLKEAIKEWFDEQYAEFGKWSIRGIVVSALGAAIYLIAKAKGLT